MELSSLRGNSPLVWGTSLYICISALPFGKVFSLFLKRKLSCFTVWRRHAHYDWQSTYTVWNVIRKSNIKLKWSLFLSLKFKETQFKMFYKIHSIEIPTNKGVNFYKLKNLENREYSWDKVLSLMWCVDTCMFK